MFFRAKLYLSKGRERQQAVVGLKVGYASRFVLIYFSCAGAGDRKNRRHPGTSEANPPPNSTHRKMAALGEDTCPSEQISVEIRPACALVRVLGQFAALVLALFGEEQRCRLKFQVLGLGAGPASTASISLSEEGDARILTDYLHPAKTPRNTTRTNREQREHPFVVCGLRNSCRATYISVGDSRGYFIQGMSWAGAG